MPVHSQLASLELPNVLSTISFFHYGQQQTREVYIKKVRLFTVLLLIPYELLFMLFFSTEINFVAR